MEGCILKQKKLDMVTKKKKYKYTARHMHIVYVYKYPWDKIQKKIRDNLSLYLNHKKHLTFN